MKTIVVLEVTHEKDIPTLADKIASRAWTLDGVRYATARIEEANVSELERAGFTLDEIALGMTEVVR